MSGIGLAAGAYTAVVDRVGAALRSLQHAGSDLVVPARPDDPPGLFRGAVVAPWPNRVVDARYRFAGTEHRLEVTERERGHALHGFSTDRTWQVGDRTGSAVVLVLLLPAQPGYPWALRLEASYALGTEGLRLELVARNDGGCDAPYGCAFHPYLACETARVDDARLRLRAATRLEVDERLVPTGTVSVADVDSDLRAGQAIGARRLDHAFTDLDRADDGTAAAELRAPDGRGVRMAWGAWAPWVQVHTTDRPEPAVDRGGLAVEPMSCPPDAFGSGRDLVVLAPGAEHRAWWTLAAAR